jgi:hypothetical protein
MKVKSKSSVGGEREAVTIFLYDTHQMAFSFLVINNTQSTQKSVNSKQEQINF